MEAEVEAGVMCECQKPGSESVLEVVAVEVKAEQASVMRSQEHPR